MAVISSSTLIDRTPEEAFDYWSKPATNSNAIPMVSMEKLTEGPVDAGTKFPAKRKTSKHIGVEWVVALSNHCRNGGLRRLSAVWRRVTGSRSGALDARRQSDEDVGVAQADELCAHRQPADGGGRDRRRRVNGVFAGRKHEPVGPVEL